ncbi:ribokinase [Coleofasciculus sp. FACHB-501]|uniref:ribokinase n=1 Tax=Cyanophyceae TaxID=3028117 RepID=UPI0016826CD2|nr:ribokinase [Coleofasciculus sp. FACHB-501]MBD1841657.1 ribokinase [Coleofasciculus sp. FACHB-501]
MTKVIVFGSINMDLMARSPRLPVAGETLRGHDFFTAAGGKGANQAVAVARLGIPTQLVGRLGADNFGRELLTKLQASGVETGAVLVDEAAHSGVAAIAVGGRGENHIIVVPGANGRVNEEDVGRFSDLLPGATALLLQFEIPMPAVVAAARAARQAGVQVILDPAPAIEMGDFASVLYPLVDIITPNEIEAGQLVGFAVDGQETAAKAAAALRQQGVGTAIVKLGDRGVFCATEEETFFVPAFPVQAVDTVAAGDAFNGGLAAALASGHPLREAVVWGAAAGAISATIAGAQPSLPDRETFDTFLRNRGIL